VAPLHWGEVEFKAFLESDAPSAKVRGLDDLERTPVKIIAAGHIGGAHARDDSAVVRH
jgi:hypothetical protein